TTPSIVWTSSCTALLAPEHRPIRKPFQARALSSTPPCWIRADRAPLQTRLVTRPPPPIRRCRTASRARSQHFRWRASDDSDTDDRRFSRRRNLPNRHPTLHDKEIKLYIKYL